MILRTPSFLDDRGLELLVFGGNGGVGKTTCAAAAALHVAAQARERSVLLASADPAHSIRDSLAGWAPPSNLQVREIDAQDCLLRFRDKNGRTLESIASAGTFLDDEDAHKLLNLSLPGLDELMAFLEIAGWVEQRAFDCMIVDTAPSEHALRLLEMPTLMRGWLGALDALLAKRKYLRKVFGGAARDSLDSYVEEWTARMKRMEALFRDPARCRFVPVALAEPLPVSATEVLLRRLRGWRVPVSDVVVNRLHRDGDCPSCTSAHGREQREIRRLRADADPSTTLWGISLLAGEVRGRRELEAFFGHAAPLEETPSAPPATMAPGPGVAAAARNLPDGVQLILWSGKGGVGKTTLACASALRFARDNPSKRVLLFSAGPANSLSACLGEAVGPRPSAVLRNLSAVEVDAAAEFRMLKDRYAEDVEDLLGAVACGCDLAFDRAVLEGMLDLAPPGVDEVMALMRLADMMTQGRYDLFVMDAPATGHLVRLLELPEIVDQWLKMFFGLLLKYEWILRMPRFSSRLIELSKKLKRFRKLLSDPERAAVYIVAIPAEMAWEETKDLIEACNRMSISAPALFLNLMTPPLTCRLCTRLRTRELAVAARYRRAFPDKLQAAIYRQNEIAGIELLAELGQGMFAESREEEPANV